MTTTTKSTAALLTEATEREVSAALLRHALSYRADAETVEHTDVLPPVGPEQVTYRLGPLEVEELAWSAGGAKVSQQIDLWIPGGDYPTTADRAPIAQHANLGKIEGRRREARLGDDSIASRGAYSVEVFPFVPLIEGRSEQDPRVALGDRHRGRKVEEVGPIEGTPKHRSQVIQLSLGTGGDVRGALQELRGMSTAAGYVAEVGELNRWADSIGDSFAAATPSRDRVIVLAGVKLQWREA